MSTQALTNRLACVSILVWLIRLVLDWWTHIKWSEHAIHCRLAICGCGWLMDSLSTLQQTIHSFRNQFQYLTVHSFNSPHSRSESTEREIWKFSEENWSFFNDNIDRHSHSNWTSWIFVTIKCKQQNRHCERKKKKKKDKRKTRKTAERRKENDWEITIKWIITFRMFTNWNWNADQVKAAAAAEAKPYQ